MAAYISLDKLGVSCRHSVKRMPPNCINDPTKDCLGYAEAQIIKASLEDLQKTVKSDRKKNRKDHKEFYQRLQYGEQAQALTQNQLAQILEDTREIKTDLKGKAQDLTNAIEKQNSAIHDMQMKPAHKWDMLGKEVFKLVITLVFGIVIAALGLGAFK